MEHPNEPAPDPEESAPPFDWNKFLAIAEVRQAMSRLPDLWAESQNRKERATAGTGIRFLVMAVILFGLGFGTVIALTLRHGISSEATAFLLGVLLTGIISVVRDFTGKR